MIYINDDDPDPNNRRSATVWCFQRERTTIFRLGIVFMFTTNDNTDNNVRDEIIPNVFIIIIKLTCDNTNCSLCFCQDTNGCTVTHVLVVFDLMRMWDMAVRISSFCQWQIVIFCGTLLWQFLAFLAVKPADFSFSLFVLCLWKNRWKPVFVGWMRSCNQHWECLQSHPTHSGIN